MKTKGLSLVHIIVITLIVAILTAIIVPIIVNTTNSNAETSTADTSDEVVVDLLNEALAADAETNGAPTTLCGVWAVLESAGYNSSVSPVYSGNEFVWYKTDNCIVLVTNHLISYPDAYVGNTLYTNFSNGPFVSLSLDETDEDAHDSSFANGTCSVCGATNN